MAILSNHSKRHQGFSLTVPLRRSDGSPCHWVGTNSMDVSSTNNRGGVVQIEPRYTDDSTAASKTFTAASDYADASNHNNNGVGWSHDFKIWDMPPAPNPWYNYTYDTGGGRRGTGSAPDRGTALADAGYQVSLYVDMHIGEGPHPTVGNQYAHIALLVDAYGAHHHYQYSGASANYTQARTIFEHSAGNQNIKVAGQNYGSEYYSQIFCLGDFQNWQAANVRNLRFINWGGGNTSASRVTIAGIQLVIHGKTGYNAAQDY
jgi:hypothetical protein